MFWFACQHHIFELILSAAIKCKLGPTFGPNDPFFLKFRDCFNGLSKNSMESIIEKAAEKIRIIAPKNDVTSFMILHAPSWKLSIRIILFKEKTT